MEKLHKVRALMKGQQTIKFENGIVLQQLFGTILVGKMKDCELEWIENYVNLPDSGKKLLYNMLKARALMLSFDTEFNIITKGNAIKTK